MSDEATELRRQLAEMTAERDLLRDILDSRAAISAALPDSYIRWSRGISAGEPFRPSDGH